LEKLGINLGYLIVQTLNFAIIFVVLRAWVYKPLLGLLEKRRTSIAQGLEDARIASEARKNAECEAERIVGEAQQKAAEIIREATERAETVELEIRATAENEVAKEREATMAEMEQERTRVLSELRSQVVSLSMAAAHKLIGNALINHEECQRSLLQEFFSGVKSGKVVVLDNAQVSGKSAEVISALPLTHEEMEIIKSEVLTKLGNTNASVTFRVDPTILGGVIVRVGDRMFDGSVSGQLSALRQTLQQ
jgi:F-type H+-transporting ATPase subunit b